MKEILKEFFELFANCLTVLCLVLVSFLILINLYHYREVSYVYEARLTENTKYQEIKTLVLDIESKLNTVNVDALPESHLNIGRNTKVEIAKCLTAIKNSKFYQLEQIQYLSQKDIYDVTMEMYSDINNVCLFYVGHYISASIENNAKLKSTFILVEENMIDERKQVLGSTEYIRDRLLANSIYSFSTEVTRNSIFNDRASDLSLTILNYYSTLKVMDDVATWYVNEFGGAA